MQPHDTGMRVVSLTAKGGQNQQHGTVADNHVASPYEILRLHRKLKAGFLLQFYEPVGLGKQDLILFFFRVAPQVFPGSVSRHRVAMPETSVQPKSVLLTSGGVMEEYLSKAFK